MWSVCPTVNENYWLRLEQSFVLGYELLFGFVPFPEMTSGTNSKTSNWLGLVSSKER